MVDIDDLNPITAVRRPFVVKAIHVTVENIHQVSELCGELITSDDPNVLPYIKVDNKKMRNRSKVRVGMYVTITEVEEGSATKVAIHGYGADSYHAQFKESTDEILSWVRYMAPPVKDDSPQLDLE